MYRTMLHNLFYYRLSTIVNCNRIICMDQGAIVEEGTHEDLMKTKGIRPSITITMMYLRSSKIFLRICLF